MIILFPNSSISISIILPIAILLLLPTTIIYQQFLQIQTLWPPLLIKQHRMTHHLCHMHLQHLPQPHSHHLGVLLLLDNCIQLNQYQFMVPEGIVEIFKELMMGLDRELILELLLLLLFFLFRVFVIVVGIISVILIVILLIFFFFFFGGISR